VRFVLDNDVDARVANVFTAAGHECWTAGNAGLAQVADDDLSVYADNKNAVLVTHDREFTQRRKKNTIGKHVRLKCPEPDACEIVARQLPELVEVLGQHDHLVVEVSTAHVKFFHARWE